MRLPQGVFYQPRSERLLAKNAEAIVRIETVAYPLNPAYVITDRDFEQAVRPYLKGDWDDFDKAFRLSPQRRFRRATQPDVVLPIHSRAEHSGVPDQRQPDLTMKLPSITVIPNLSIAETRDLPGPLAVLGCTMGEYLPRESDGDRTRQVYEFQSYGLLALDREAGEVELWVARDGDKIAIPGGCHVTLYNLGDADNPLVTLDFADPKHNPSNEALAETYGPVLLAYYDDVQVVIVLSHHYIHAASDQSPRHKAGVRLASPPQDRQAREVRIVRGARLGLGELLYQELTENTRLIARFGRLGLQLLRASPDVTIERNRPDLEPRLRFARPLVEASQPGTEVHRFFLNGQYGQDPSLFQRKRRIADVGTETARQKKEIVQLRRLNRPLRVVVEGAGKWVEGSYRPLFIAKNNVPDSPGVKVFYADDTRWSDGRPGWVGRREDWESYRDKADLRDLQVYQTWNADAVFVVTPDFTHSAIARWWIGKASLVFVEKPFDSHFRNVQVLFGDVASQRSTAILGLDHYQFYALPLHDLMSTVEAHLDGIARVTFYMTEQRPIELGREKTLQHGLTLDLLPHLLAMLAYFGNVASIDDIKVHEARQYEPLKAVDPDNPESERDLTGIFRNETYSSITFTFEDYSKSGYRVPCQAILGKGLGRDVKYLEIVGVNDNAVRVDFNRAPTPNPHPNYPWDSLFFIQGNQRSDRQGIQLRNVKDPYAPPSMPRDLQILDPPDPDSPYRPKPLDRNKYGTLLDDLLKGESNAVASTLVLPEATAIVVALERIWTAVQDSKMSDGTWEKYVLGELHPVRD